MNPAIRNFVEHKLPWVWRVITAARYEKSRQKIRRILKERREVSIELGSGAKGKGEWLTIDLSRKSDIYWDLRKGLPFPNECLQKIYSSHFFEHLTYSQAQALLDECMRVLVPGGKFLICVPNARIFLEAYVKGISLDPSWFAVKHAYNLTTSIDYANYVAYMGEGVLNHKYMFDQENLLHILKAKGFKNVRARPFDPDLDLEMRHHESIYAEGEK